MRKDESTFSNAYWWKNRLPRQRREYACWWKINSVRRLFIEVRRCLSVTSTLQKYKKKLRNIRTLLLFPTSPEKHLSKWCISLIYPKLYLIRHWLQLQILLFAYSPPQISAKYAVFLMHTNYLATLWACPFFFFLSYEISYAGSFYILQIINHTHTVFCSIAVIEMLQVFTWEAVAIKAILDFVFCHQNTCFNFAHDAGLRLGTIVCPATGTRVFFSQVCTAQPAVHSAGRY